MIFALDFFFFLLHDIPIPQTRWRWASLPQQRLGGGEVRGERERRGELAACTFNLRDLFFFSQFLADVSSARILYDN